MSIIASRQSSDSLAKAIDSVKEKLIVVALGGIPFSGGRLLRRFFYRSVFSKIKDGVQIFPGILLHNPQGIHLGTKVKIESFVRLSNSNEGSKICLGDEVVLRRHVEIKTHAPAGENATIEVGKNTHIGPYVCLSGQNIQIGENCLVGPYVGVFANNHMFEDLDCPICEQGNSYAGIKIGDNCWLGTGVKVLDGVTIGSGSVVGAGSVVTQDLPPYSVAVGVPARVVRKRDGRGKKGAFQSELRLAS